MKKINNKGSILAISIIFIFIFMLLGMFSMRLVILQNETSDSELYYTRTHFAALYGTELALYRIMQWENLATTFSTNTAVVNSDGRKFLAKQSGCLGWDGARWNPLEGLTGSVEGIDFNPDIANNFSDRLSGSPDKSGIIVVCEVEEDLSPNISDGFKHSPADEQYGTFKYYVIKTTATMYNNAETKETAIAVASDQLYFMIAYSSGTVGSKPLMTIPASGSDPAIPGFDAMPGMSTTTIRAERPYIESAPKRSMLTKQVLPVFRYYIRARR